MHVYVNLNLTEVFVNDGEAVISNTVYDLGKEIEADVKMRIETLEK
ncbi:GH32 C-terminal domain-containing protein [Blautia sp.]